MNNQITTEDISRTTKINHSSVFKLAASYHKILNNFGMIEFTMIYPSKKGGRPKTVIKLNEKQAKMLILLMRNTEETVKQKKNILSELLNK